MSLRVFYEVLNQRGTPALFTDTFANRPTFGFQGRLFISTDTAQIFEDTGTAWTLIADAGGSGFVPYTGATADVNLGSFDLTADIGIFNQVKAVGSGGLSINANSGTQIALLGAGGGANVTFYGGLTGTTASFINSSASTGLDVASDKVIFRANTGVSTPRQVEISMGGATSTFLDAKGFGANYITDFGIRTYNSSGTAFNVFYGTSAGNVIIGGTTDAGFRFDCVGTARVSGLITGTSGISISGGSSSVINGLGFTSGSVGATGIGIYASSGMNFVTDQNISNYYSFGFWFGFSSAAQWLNLSKTSINIGQGASTPNIDNITYTSVNIVPTFNSNFVGRSGNIVRGIYYNPTITSFTNGVRNQLRAIETSIGGAYFNTTSVDGSSILQADSTSQGFLPPRMTTAQRNAITSPATGLIVFDTDIVKNYVYNGTNWQGVIIPNSSNNTLVNSTIDNGQGALQVSGNIYVTGIGAAGSTYSVSSTLSTAYYHVFTGAAGQTLTLPSPASNNVQYVIINTTANTVDVAAATSTNIVTTLGTSVASITLIANQRVFIIANGGTNYFQIF